jgi:hypothetical protein
MRVEYAISSPRIFEKIPDGGPAIDKPPMLRVGK